MSLLTRFTETRMPPELKERLRATREAALTQLIASVIWVALFALLAFIVSAMWGTGQWAAVLLNSLLFATLVTLHFFKRWFPYAWRAGIFTFLLYGVALALLSTAGISSAGRLYLLSFAVIATIFFGMRVGVWAAVLSLVTWAAFAVAFTFFLPAPADPPNSAALADWLSAFFGLLLLLVTLIVPQRQFLETQTTAIVTAFEKSALEEARAALQKKTEELEDASKEAGLINQQLQTQAEVIQHRAAQLALSAEVARSVASLHALPELLTTTVQLISERFDYYHAGVFLADDAREWAVLQAANSEGGQRMLARQHRLRIGRQGIVGHVVATGQPRIAQDVGGDTVHYVNPDLPDTRSELALPLSVRGLVIGALDVQSTSTNAFSDEDVRVLQTLADQLGVAIENARLFAATQRNIEELRALQREARRQAPTLGEAAPLGYRYDGVNVAVLGYGEARASDPTPDVLRIPLNVGDEALGVIEIKRQGGEGWSPDDVELTEAIANRMTLALENARLYDQAQARAQQMTNLSEAALELTGPQFSLPQLLEAIGKRGLKLFQADYVSVWLPVGHDELELRLTQTATDSLTAGRRLKRGEGLAGEVFVTGRITRLADYQTWSGRAETTGEVALRAVLGVPMTWQHDVLGVLVLSHTESDRPFTNDDERAARLFATQAAAALENARLLQETQDRISELATINTVSQVATAQLDLTTLLDTIGDQIFRTFRVSAGYIALYNPETNLIEFPYVLEGDKRILNYPPIPYGDGLSSIILRSRQPLLVNQETERRLTDLGAQVTSGLPAQSFLGVPILVGESAIGLISLQSVEAEGLFDEADQRLLTTIAASVGAALQNARLFEQTQRRVAELATINTISQTLAASQLDLRATLNLVGDKILQTFPDADGGYIGLYNSRTNQIEVPYFRDAEGGLLALPPVPLGQGLASHVIQTRQPLLVNQDTAQRAQTLGAILTGQPSLSYLGVPMIVGDDVVGVLSVQSLAREGLFNDGDVRLLVTIAANVGVALQNARLFEQTQAALSENRTLFLISRTLAQVTSIAEILDTVVTYALPAGADRASLITFHTTEPGDIRELEVVGFRDLQHEYQRLGVRLPAAAAPFITRLEAEPVIISDTQAAPDLDMFTRQTFQQFNIQATCLVPLRASGKLIGLLTASARQPTQFAREAMPLLQATADQVAVTMEKLRLLAETQRRADQLATAAEVSRVANSVLNPDQLIVQVVELIRERFNLYYSALFLVDETGQWARLRHATGEAGRELMERQHQLEVGGHSMIGQAVARREARIALDVGAGGGIEAMRFVNPLLPDTRSEMALPLAVGPAVIGAVSVQSTQPNAFSPADITVLQTMVDQVAISLQNARLFTAAQRELAERTRAEALLAGQRRILELIAQGQALPHILDALARFVEERADKALCSILLMDPNGQNLRRGAAPNLPQDFTDTVDGLLIGPRAGACGTAAYLKQQVITTDIAHDPIWADYRDWIINTHGLRAAWSTPILSVNDQVLGTLAIYHREVKAPTPRDVELMGIVTYLAGVAIARYQSQQALDYERYLLHTLLENVPDKIYFKDRESRFIRASRGVAQQFGLTQDTLIGKSDFDFFTEEHARQAYRDEQDMLATGQSVLGKLERETWPDRPDSWVLTSKLVMRDVGGEVIGSFGISRDVTELKQAQDAAQRRAQLLAAAAEIGRAATASLEVEALLRTSVNLIRDRFGFYHASIFIIDSKTHMAVVRESTGEAGAALKARGHQLAVGSNSLVGRATATRQPVVVQDVTADLTHFKNPLLPDTRAEAVLPLLSGDRVIGALDVQSASANAFAAEDMAILATIADQLAVAIQNANLFDRTARTARRERLVGEITNKIRAASSVETMLQTAVTELRQALGVSHGVVKLGPSAAEDKLEDNGRGSNGSKGNGASGA